MVKDEYISLGDSFIEIQGNEKQIAQFNDDILGRKKNLNYPQNHYPKLL